MDRHILTFVCLFAVLFVACEGQFWPRPRPYFCYQRRETGPCYAAIPRYYYDPFWRTCRQFTYGGCMGNRNNFETFFQCAFTCMRN